MRMRMQDFECEKCHLTTEVLLDTSKPDKDQAACDHCGSKKMFRIMTVGSGKGSNITWSKWRV